MHLGNSTDPYRVGLGAAFHDYRINVPRYGRKHALRMLAHQFRAHGRRRSFWGFWQAEWPGCERAVRGFTAPHCHRRAARVRGGG